MRGSILALCLFTSTARAQGGWTEEVVVPSAAYLVQGAPSAVVHAPPAWTPQSELRIVVFLHGWNGCARVLAGEGLVRCRAGMPPRQGWGLARAHDASGTDALLVIPQLAFLERDGRPGAFGERGRFRAFLAEVLAALAPRLGGADLTRVRSVSLFAHSAGFETALALVARGEVPIEHVVLFDALYRGVEPFGSWALGGAGRRLVSLHGAGGRTERQSELLSAWARRHGLPVASAPGAGRVSITLTRVPHERVPAHHWPAVARALGLAPRAPSPP